MTSIRDLAAGLAAAALVVLAPNVAAADEAAAEPAPAPAAEPAPAPATEAAPAAAPAAPADAAPAAEVAVVAKPDRWTDHLDIGGGATLYYYQPLESGQDNNFDLFYANLVLDGKVDTIGLHIEPRFRATKLRPFFDGPAWVEEAYAYGKLGPVTVKVGKIYSRQGLFWDDSFYGSILVYDGLKLTPDYGVSAEGVVAPDAKLGLAYWGQYFIIDGATNVSLVGRDTISIPGARRRNEVVGRVEPFYKLGDDGVLKVGVSGQYLQADLPEGTNDVFRAGADATVRVGHFGAWGEYFHQSGKHVDGFPIAPVVAAPPAPSTPGQASGDNHYVLVGASYAYRKLVARYNYSYADYADVEVSEQLHEPALGYQVSQNLSLLAELVLWSHKAPVVGTTDYDRSLNVTLHGSF